MSGEDRRVTDELLKELLRIAPGLAGTDWRGMISNIPVLQKLAFSKEGFQFNNALQNIRKRVSKVFLEEELITADEAIDFGIIDLLRRYSEHVQQLEEERAQDG